MTISDPGRRARAAGPGPPEHPGPVHGGPPTGPLLPVRPDAERGRPALVGMAMAAVGEHGREVADAARSYPRREKRLVVPERALAVSNLYR